MAAVRKVFPLVMLTFFAALVAGFWLASRSMFDQLGGASSPAPADAGFPSVSRQPLKQGAVSGRVAVVEDEAALKAGALEKQRVLKFADEESLRRFLARPDDGIRVLGVVPALGAVRVAFDDLTSLAAWLSEDHEEMMVFPVAIPLLTEGMVQPDALEVGDRLLKLLGVDAASVNWGTGVKVAILDTGVVPGEGLGRVSQLIELVPSSSDLAAHNGHGTAVASMVVGRDPRAPGVAPAAEIISIRVANDEGWSDSFLLAQGIVEATNAGARLINISLGGFGDSQVLRDAVDYALGRGALVIASVGNNGLDRVQYPAAIPGVIGVGAVDAAGRHLMFSNSGEQVDVAAPGWGINSTWTDGNAVRVSGTSFSAPVVTGALAAIMSGGAGESLDARRAWELMSSYLNDAGAEGADVEYGAGMPDLGRVLQRDLAGIHDAAVASLNWLAPDARNPYGQLEVLVQNRGTERLLNTALSIDSGGVVQQVNLTALDVGAVQTVRVPVSKDFRGLGEAYQVSSSVMLSGGEIDTRPFNDRMDRVFMDSGTP